MAWLVMNDEVDYSSTWYPTHIVGSNNEVIPIFIGASNTMIRGLVGLYVRDDDYYKIRHDKAYIFIHNPEAKDEKYLDKRRGKKEYCNCPFWGAAKHKFDLLRDC